MPASKQFAECYGRIAFIEQFFCLRVRIETLLRLTEVVKIGMQRRKPCLIGPFILRDSELGSESEIFQDKPFKYEVVCKPESGSFIVIVEMGIPERIRDRIIIEALFGIIQVFIYAPPRNCISCNKGSPERIQRTERQDFPYQDNL